MWGVVNNVGGDMLFWNNVVLPSLIGWIGKMRQPLKWYSV